MHLDQETIIHIRDHCRERYEGIKDTAIQGLSVDDYHVACGKAAGFKELVDQFDEWLETMNKKKEAGEKKNEAPY